MDLVLVPLPSTPPARHVGAILFTGVQAFFKAETNMVEEMPDSVVANLDPTLVQFRQQTTGDQIPSPGTAEST